MSDIVSQPNDSTEVSLRKAVELLGQIETKTGAAEITGEVTVSNEVEIKNNDNNPVPVSGTVTAQGFDAANELAAPIPLNDGATAVIVQPEGVLLTYDAGENFQFGTITLTHNVAQEISHVGNGVNGFNTVVLEINTSGVTFGSFGFVAQAHNQTGSPTDQQIMCPLGVRITHSADSTSGLSPSSLGTVGYVNLEPNGLFAGYHGTRLNAYEYDTSLQTANLPTTGTRFFIFDLTTSRFFLKASFTAGTITVNYRLYRTRHPAFSARKVVVSGESTDGSVRVAGSVDASVSGSVYMDGGYLDDTTSITGAINDALDNSGVSGVGSQLGAATDASATTDTGTFSLISLFKRLLGKLPSLTASSRVPVDVLPSSVTLVNAGSNFSYSGAGNHGAFDCGDADFVVYTVNGGGGGFAHNIELSNASNFSNVSPAATISTSSNAVLVYNERYPSNNSDTIAYKFSNSNLQSGSAGTYVINLTQGTAKYTFVRVVVTGGGGGGWTGRFTSYRSALRDGGASNTSATPLHRVPIAGVVDINTCINSIPVAGTVTANAGTGTYTIQPRNGAVTKTRGTTSSTANTSAAAPSPLNVTDSNRRYLLIQNISDTDMYVNFGAAATTDDLLISKNGGGVVFESGFVPTDSVNVICSAASKKYFILSA